MWLPWRRRTREDDWKTGFVTTGPRHSWPVWATERTRPLPTVEPGTPVVRPYINAAEQRAQRQRRWLG